MLRMLRLVVVTAAIVGGAACASVQPWQRGRLANPAMQFDPDTGLTAYAGHWQESREGAAGGSGLQGGGCGCK
jgi:hypothetical protein